MKGPRRRLPTVVAWVVVATLLPAAALGWLGWRVIDQDRALEQQRVQDFLASTANRVTADIERDLGTIERTLGSAGKAVAGPVDSATMVRVDRTGRSTAIEGTALAYALTVEPTAAEPPDSIWHDAERLEFADHDLAAAARMYRELARSADRNVRAAALLRLARTLKRAAQPDEALRAYAALQQLDRATINGDPADLLARWARAELFATLNRPGSSADETASLDADYLRGRWRLDRTTALAYAELLRRWRSDADDEKLARRIALTDAVAATWQGWRSSGVTTAPDSGRRSIRAGATEILTLARETDDGLVVFGATPLYLSHTWERLWAPPNVAVSLLDRDGQPLAGVTPGGPGGNDGTAIVRRPSETRLPWAIRVAAVSTPAEVAETGALRRRLIVAALGLVALLIAITGYLAIRAAAKQLALGRQQADFVAAVSHEFRSPLTSLSHLTSLLRSDFQPSEERRKQYYDVLALETDRLRRFVDTLLDFGRMQAGAARYRLAAVNPATFAATVVDEFRQHASCGAHTISCTAATDVPLISADVEALSRALWNLLENAAKYSPDQSAITVRVESASGPGSEARVAIRVTDRGVGIPASEVPSLFDQFFRGAAATESAIKGTGVGLAVVRHIVSGHGGEITVDSTVGAGSTFSILLPAVVAAEHGGERRVS